MKTTFTTILCSAALAITTGACKKKEDGKKETKPAGKAITKQPVKQPPVKKKEPPKMTMSPDKRIAECYSLAQKKDPKFADCYTADATSSMPNSKSMHKGGKAIAMESAKFYQAFPDTKSSPQLVMINGNNAVAFVHATGTNTGAMPMMGLAKATNKKFGTFGIHFVEMAGDKIKTERWYWDNGTLMAQLGLSKQPMYKPEDIKPWEKAEVVKASKNPTEQKNLAATKSAMEMMNKNDPKAADLYADDITFWHSSMPKATVGKKNVMKEMGGWMKAFPDMKSKLTNVWAAGDYVVMENTATGTNKGPIPGMTKKATNKPIQIHHASILKFKDGKVTHEWVVGDGASFAMQLGLMKMPAAGAKADAAKKEAPKKAAPKKKAGY